MSNDISTYLRCIVCSKLLELKCIPADTVVEELTNRFKIFCEFLETTSNVLVSRNFDFFQEPFPFCENCKEKIELLSHYHSQILRIHEHIQAIMMTITSDVVESFEDPRNHHLSKLGNLEDVSKPHEVADTLLKKINAFRTQIFHRFTPWVPILPSEDDDLKTLESVGASEKLAAAKGSKRVGKQSEKMPDPTKYIFSFESPVKVEGGHEHDMGAGMDHHEDFSYAQSVDDGAHIDGTEEANVDGTSSVESSIENDIDVKFEMKTRSSKNKAAKRSPKKTKKWSMHMEGRVFCQHCQRSFLSQSVLDWHMRQKHAALLDPAELAAVPDPKAYLPVVGGPKRNRNSDGIENDNENVPESLRCHICQKTFKKNEYLVNHLARHDGRTKFNCEYCDKKFLKKYSLTLHMRVHLDLRPFQCSECGKFFRCKPGLNAHQAVHNKEATLPPTFECDQCPKKYHELRSFIRHRETVHLGMHRERNFMCELCGKSFLRKCYLNDHGRSCRSKKPRKNAPQCYICGEICSSHVELVKHIELHYEGKIPCAKSNDVNQVKLSVPATTSSTPCGPAKGESSFENAKMK